jgi:xylulokinase
LKEIFLGLDLGTTNCKVLAVDADGQPVAGASLPTPVQSGNSEAGSGAPEFDAEALWQVSAGLLRQVVEALPHGRRVVAVAVASMGEAGVLVDEAGRSLAPVMTWHDRRTLPWVAWWRQRISPASLYEITGLPLDHIYSANKLLWLRQQSPQAFGRARHWLCLADWITFRLTGLATTSYSLASRTMLFDLRTRTWSDELLQLAGLPAALMPPALPSGEIAGTITAEVSRVTGLSSGMPVVIGGHDHICACGWNDPTGRGA